jgi:ParB family chromosome partitioning protein
VGDAGLSGVIYIFLFFLEGALMIECIDIGRLFVNPDNPRKDLGDLTELRDSIRAQGVLQNLTVVPAEDEGSFFVVIGHRRLAAARLAGLVELPCVVVDMDRKTQVAVMMVENMQRCSLSLVEECEGLQLMIDLGEPVKAVSKLTGLSAKTVSRRVKLIGELGSELLLSAQGRDIKLEDYEKLYKVKDRSEREKLFGALGTADFNWKIKNAVEEQTKCERLSRLVEVVSAFAVESSFQEFSKRATGVVFSVYNTDCVKAAMDFAADLLDVEYFYCSDSGSVSVFTKKASVDGSPSEREKLFGASVDVQRAEEERKERAAEVFAAFRRAFELRLEFARGFRASKKLVKPVSIMAIDAIFISRQRSINVDVFGLLRGIKKFRNDWEEPGPDKGESFGEVAGNYIAENLGAYGDVEFVAAYCLFEDKGLRCCDFNGKYDVNRTLELLYKHLCALGYVMSSEESALLDGSHVLFVPVERVVDGEREDK